MATPGKDRSHWPVKKFASHEEMRDYGIKQWQELWYVGKEDLITAKKAVGRNQDLHDIEEINGADS